MSLDLFDILWQEILNEPEEDLPRLAYADALDDRGGEVDLVRADFIRAQIEKSKIPDKDYRCTEMDPNFMPQRVIGGWTSQTPCGKCQRCQIGDRVRRGLILLSQSDGLRHWPVNRRINPSDASFYFRKGFVSEVALTVNLWQEWGKRLCRKWPLTLVTLSEKFPDRYEGSDQLNTPYFWQKEAHPQRRDGMVSRQIDYHGVPRWLWKLTGIESGVDAGFSTKDEANAWLSALCLKWAREKKRVFV